MSEDKETNDENKEIGDENKIINGENKEPGNENNGTHDENKKGGISGSFTGFVEIIGLGSKIYATNLGYIAILCVIAFLPVFIIGMFIPAQYAQSAAQFRDVLLSNTVVTSNDLVKLSKSPVFTNYATLITLLAGIELAFFPLVTGGITYIAEQNLNNGKVSLLGILDVTILRFYKYFITSGILALLFFLTSPIFVFTIFIAVIFIYYQNVIAYTGRWGLSAFVISRSIVKGRWFKTLGGSLLIFLLHFIFSQTIDVFMLQGVAGSNTVLIITVLLVSKVLLSLFTVIFAVWFISLCRLKGIGKTKEVINIKSL